MQYNLHASGNKGERTHRTRQCRMQPQMDAHSRDHGMHATKSACITSHRAACRKESHGKDAQLRAACKQQAQCGHSKGLYTYHSQDAPRVQQLLNSCPHMHMHTPGPHTAQAGRQVMTHCDRYKAHDPHSRPDWCRQARAKDARQRVRSAHQDSRLKSKDIRTAQHSQKGKASKRHPTPPNLVTTAQQCRTTNHSGV